MSTPEQIGRYRVEGRLGSGAFGIVWLAHDDRLQAPVAIKVMAENWASRIDIRERFLTEARLMRKATAGGVAQVFDIGELPDERPYFVMEYADRGTVADRTAAGPMAVSDALRLTAQAARGVSALYEAGVVHRDIKPSNLLLAGGGTAGQERVLVADLGLAKHLAQASGLTVVAGSLGYMAPEQAEPADGIDGRADVYSLGAVLYHLVTGTTPGPPDRLIEPNLLCPDLPRELTRAVLTAMEPEPERRWPTAAAFAEELDRLDARFAGSSGEEQPRAPTSGTATRDAGGPETVQDTGTPHTQPADGPTGERAAEGRGAGASEPEVRTPEGPEAEGAEREPRRGMSRRRRRRATTVGTAAVVLLAAGAAGVTATLLNRPTTPSVTRVNDVTKRISFEMPKAWADQKTGSGWDPVVVGLREQNQPSQNQPGITVAQDVHRFRDLTAPVNGVFVGTDRNTDLVDKVDALSHRGCSYAGSRTFSNDAWHGRVRTWSSCNTPGHSLEEISLTSTHKNVPAVYAQVRCDEDCARRTDRVLRSLRVSGSPGPRDTGGKSRGAS